MTQEELLEKYKVLYGYMAASNEPKYMKLFGEVMNEMMAWMVKNQPSAAEMWVEKLCAIKWEQYLTKNEAAKVVESLEPEAPWNWEVWNRAMSNLGLETERKGVYNKYALWAEMNAKYSDHAESLAKYAFEMPLNEVPAEKMVALIHSLAVGSLTDEDGKFNVRDYFLR